MPNIEAIVRQINKYLVPQFEKKLRAYLAEQDRDGRIEQIVRLTLDAHSLDEMAWSSLSAWSTILRLIKNFSTVVWKKIEQSTLVS